MATVLAKTIQKNLSKIPWALNLVLPQSNLRSRMWQLSLGISIFICYLINLILEIWLSISK